MFLYRIRVTVATGVAKLMNASSNAVALIMFMYFGSVNYVVGSLLGLSMMIGAYFGANSAIKHQEKLIKPLLLVLVIFLSLFLLYQNWKEL